MSHRHYCPDLETCKDRVPCCLWTEGDCCCDYEDQCRKPPAARALPEEGS
ncbi:MULTISPECIES: hypothetical protein [unclassified Streptomyces]|nr:hypothetical protein [Streptomyces sp. NBC_00285]